MPDLKHDLQHLNNDVAKIHDLLAHLKDHSRICNDLIKNSNVREASEMFEHLEQIDKLVHDVQKHITHIKNHIDREQGSGYTTDIEPLDIDDLKHDASHTSFDLKDIHAHIEHLITHSNMCRDIIEPGAEKELIIIRKHLEEIDVNAHELLEHIKDIRGKISTKYSEFIWSIPEGLTKFLKPTELIDSNEPAIKNMALKLVDGCDSVQDALVNILLYVRDFVVPTNARKMQCSTASQALNTLAASANEKSVLACALARAIIIPARIHFARLSKELLQEFCSPDVYTNCSSKITISWPEFYDDSLWVAPVEIFERELDVNKFYDKFMELGIQRPETVPDPSVWQRLSSIKFDDDGIFADPSKYLASDKFLPANTELDKKLFAGYIYID